jgi:hypothetical protein
LVPTAVDQVNQSANDHFAEVGRMVSLGSGSLHTDHGREFRALLEHVLPDWERRQHRLELASARPTGSRIAGGPSGAPAG